MSPWLFRSVSSVAPRLRLICFPYAGGGSSVFRSWIAGLPAAVELVALRLPGRESRFAEAPYTDWPQLVDDVVAELRPLLDVPFLLFGHSFGGMLAYEVARAVYAGGKRPQALIVSGCRSPHVRPHVRAPYDSPTAAFWAWVAEMSGTPAAVIGDPQLRALVEPVLRADLKLADTWSGDSTYNLPSLVAPKLPICGTKAAVDMTIVTFGGADDRVVPRGEIEGWREYTRRPYRHVEFAGGHFFIHTVEAKVVAEVSALCRAA